MNRVRRTDFRPLVPRPLPVAAGARMSLPPRRPPGSDWRQQALDWLNAELTAMAGLLENGSLRERAGIPKRLGRWQIDPALAGVRDHEEIASLAEDERRVIRNLWSLVDSLLEQARNSIAQASPPRPS